jgi:hypothetical protein
MKRLSPQQEKCLLRKHLCGEFPACRWATVESLIKLGMLAEDGKHLIVTDNGKEYCDTYHLEIKL